MRKVTGLFYLTARPWKILLLIFLPGNTFDLSKNISLDAVAVQATQRQYSIEYWSLKFSCSESQFKKNKQNTKDFKS